jgi:hypothetical protein
LKTADFGAILGLHFQERRDALFILAEIKLRLEAISVTREVAARDRALAEELRKQADAGDAEASRMLVELTKQIGFNPQPAPSSS